MTKLSTLTTNRPQATFATSAYNLRSFRSRFTSQNPSRQHSLNKKMDSRLGSWLFSTKKGSLSSTVAGAASSPSRGIARTPHSPYHYADQDSTNSRRCFEGWYLKVTLPDHRSVAFIHCIEDPSGNSPFSKVTSQVIWGPGGVEDRSNGNGHSHNGNNSKNQGHIAKADSDFPKEGFLLQHGRDVNNFWASSEAMEFGGTYNNDSSNMATPKQVIEDESEFFKHVQSGFQASEKLHCGSLEATTPDGDMMNRVLPETEPIVVKSSASRVKWSYKMEPVHGWGNALVANPEAAAAGDSAAQQDIRPPETNGGESTTGWLALSPLFDPQWQICTAHAAATGYIEIDGQRIEFSNAPAYVEKNWGAGFPKWFWMQCNAFPGHPDLTVTAVGAHRRSIQQPTGAYVDAGIIGVHYKDMFIECLPWNAKMEWEVQPWGSWRMSGSSGEFDVEITATTPKKESKGTWLYGPHEKSGFIPYCQDAFSGRMRMKIWRRKKGIEAVGNVLMAASAVVTGEDRDVKEGMELILDVTSYDAAVECGGGPWNGLWKSECDVPKLLKDSLLGPVAWVKDKLSVSS